MKYHLLVFSVIVFFLSGAAHASKLLTFEWAREKAKIDVTLDGKSLTLNRGDFHCKAKVLNSKLFNYGPAQFMLKLEAMCNGCERVIGRNQLLEIEVSNFDHSKKLAYPTRVKVRIGDEAASMEREVSFLNSELLVSVYKETTELEL